MRLDPAFEGLYVLKISWYREDFLAGLHAQCGCCGLISDETSPNKKVFWQISLLTFFFHEICCNSYCILLFSLFFFFWRTREELNNVAYNFMRHKNFWTVSRILPQLFGSLRGLESSSLEINKLSIHDEENQTCAVDFGCGICKSMREIFAVVERSMC